ncbi:cytochrome P450 [Amycolatopsis sp. WGS_07]|uniref:cytochrome P450 n=1 Tax=Amycolatopsis sp. WGS_07 TaxID=3076764 RepID=UPI003872C637
MTNAADVVRLDPSDPAFSADRHTTYRRLRETAPVARTVVNGQDSWLLTGYAEVEKALKSAANVVQPRPGEFPAHIGAGPAAEFYRFSLPNVDAPAHTRLRKLAAPAFQPRSVKRMRAWVEEIILGGLDELAERDDVVDFVREYAMKIPALIACRLLHAPPQDATTVLERMPGLNAVLSQGDITPEQLAEADATAQFYFDYIGDIVDTMRGKLDDDDPVGALLLAEADGERLSRTELVVTLVGFFVASYHTTMVAMTNAVYALARHQDQFRRLAEDPSLAGAAWEENLRFEAPVHFVWRYAGAGTELSGTPIREGEHLLLGLAAANRDPARFARPDTFDVGRTDNRHLAFTAGGHFCLGAPLSRLEGRSCCASCRGGCPRSSCVPTSRRARPT